MQELLELPSKIYYLSFVWFSSSPSDDWYFQVALTSDQSLSPSWIGGHFNSLPGNPHSRLCTSFALEFILPSEHRMQETHHSHDLDDYKVANSFGVALQHLKTISKWCPVPSLEIGAILNLSPSPQKIDIYVLLCRCMISCVNFLPISCWPIRHQQVTISVTFLFMSRDNWYLWILSLT